MKVAIVGSREWGDPKAVCNFIDSLPRQSIVVTGGARGVDKIAQVHATKRGLRVILCVAPWEAEGAKAGPLRNALIVELSDVIVAFWDGQSPGTLDVIKRCSNKKLHIVKPNERIIYDRENLGW